MAAKRGIPVFDPKASHSTVVHGDYDADVRKLPRYVQGGHHFTASGEWIEELSPPLEAPEVRAPVDSTPLLAVSEDEIPRLLDDPRAVDLLKLTRDTIVDLVTSMRGPVVGGQQAQQYMVAWLIKNTAG